MCCRGGVGKGEGGEGYVWDMTGMLIWTCMNIDLCV